eukprot:CAMPEP_0177669862 /NCGR_PEP_ID=MMETSP0447-20121125/23722_1 /TAXON_ID=0 /ORGANISM="Stygamoeba regulata, Strain BSH-02190019" /LENGTH=221 /DNA_ID=CAMNT_0019176867 /DNA_START=373 /DNA_END=1038 /DNA_ORIENTATION=+
MDLPNCGDANKDAFTTSEGPNLLGLDWGLEATWKALLAHYWFPVYENLVCTRRANNDTCTARVITKARHTMPHAPFIRKGLDIRWEPTSTIAAITSPNPLKGQCMLTWEGPSNIPNGTLLGGYYGIITGNRGAPEHVPGEEDPPFHYTDFVENDNPTLWRTTTRHCTLMEDVIAVIFTGQQRPRNATPSPSPLLNPCILAKIMHPFNSHNTPWHSFPVKGA